MKDELTEAPANKVENRNITDVLNRINEKKERQMIQDMTDRQERIRKKRLARQRMGYTQQPAPEMMHAGYPPQMHPDQQYYAIEKDYDQYDEYDPYMEQPPQEYDMYASGPVKNEYMDEAPQPMYNPPVQHYPADPRNPGPVHQILPPVIHKPEPVKSEEPEEGEGMDEYDPLNS